MSDIIAQLKAADAAANAARTAAIKNPTPENIAAADAAGIAQDRAWANAAQANQSLIDQLTISTDALKRTVRQ